MKSNRRNFLKSAFIAATATQRRPAAASFTSAWPDTIERVFVGPEYWANRLQDWRIRMGRVECIERRPASPMRTLHLLTRRLGDKSGSFEIEVRTGMLDTGPAAADAAAGFLIGAGGRSMDYRAAALIHHQPGPGGGLFAGCTTGGMAFIQDFEAAAQAERGAPRAGIRGEITLRLSAVPDGSQYRLTLTALTAAGQTLSTQNLECAADRLIGNVALVSHPGTGNNAARFWFRDWRLKGEKIEAYPGRACGPILSTLYTIDRGVLKMTAQLMPVGAQESQTAELQIKQGRAWNTLLKSNINPSGWIASFRIEPWDINKDVEFRVRYLLTAPDGVARPHDWNGTFKRDPIAKGSLVVASLSCVQQIDGNLIQNPTYRWKDRVWFPHADMTRNLQKHRADLFFFAGDQIYEGNPTRVVRTPAGEAELDYLYKWYLWCWSFGGLVRHTPCICIPDDHDVYHGNIWGMGGKASAPDDPGGLRGGYGMPPEWLNMIQRTQTSHLPDPYDPTPAEQGVGVYYTSLTCGGVGFAILEDRKFKSSPAIVKARMTNDSHIIEKDFDTRKADLPGATQLGDRQLKFLHEFSKDWRGQTMKAALSQTIFCSLQISSRPPTTGELDKDLDSNGWPQSGRKAALRELRRGFMIHLAGDQHLASAIQHGIDDFGDACWSQCSPAIANLYIRFWNPNYPSQNPGRNRPAFLGDYEDGFHNKITVHAVANPVNEAKPGQFPEPVDLHRKATGYNIVRFNKEDRTITLETWPRYADPTNPKTGTQYPGWPITIQQADNYGRKPVAHLPVLKVAGMRDPVIQVIEEANGEVVYTIRIKGSQFRAPVYARGKYTIHVGELGTDKVKTLSGIAAVDLEKQESLTVQL